MSINSFVYKLKHFLVLSVLSTAGLCLNATLNAAVYPGDDWASKTPEQMGVDRDALNRAVQKIRDYSGSDSADEVLIIRDGYVIYSGSDTYNWHEIWSVTKSFTGTALGLLIDEGRLTLDSKVANQLPELANQYSNVRYKHFASHTSGYNAEGASRWCNGCNEDWSTTPYRPANALFSPGSQFLYWDEAMMMFSRALTKELGDSLKNYLYRKIANPIGMDFEWNTEGSIDGIGINNGGGWMFTHARDLARFAYLYEREGNWNGTQLISKDWINKATQPQHANTIPANSLRTSPEGGPGVYGYNFWVNGVQSNGQRLMPNAPAKTYYMSGLNHNVAFIMPEWDMVIVRMGQDGNPSVGKHNAWNDILGTLAPGVGDIPGADPKPVDPQPVSTNVRLKDNWNGFYINTNSEQEWQQISMQTLNQNWGSMKWYLEDAGDGNYRLKNEWTGLYLNATSDEEWTQITTAALREDWGSMKWQLETVAGDASKVRLKNVWSGYYLNSAAEAGDAPLLAAKRDEWGSMIFDREAF